MPSGIKFFGEGLPYLKTSDLKGKLIAIEGTDGVGRSTQIELLEDWLQVQGFGVVVTGWTRSNLAGAAIEMAKGGNMIDRMTLGLLYATDFADRLENQILPALRSGFVVIADRYIYNAFARDSARDPDSSWIKEVYGFAPVPDLVCYLRLDVDNHIPRVIESGGMNYWESGMDLHLADNIFDSFKKYQKTLIQSYDDMVMTYGFEVIDARRSVAEIQQDLQAHIENVVKKTRGSLIPLPSGRGFEKPAKAGNEVANLNARQIEKRLQTGVTQIFGQTGAEISVGEERLILSPLPPPDFPGSNDKVIPFSSATPTPARSPEDSGSTNSA
ncbi:MAG: thymidylate kinase [Deltaproteobacteria bacterium]|nr:thymidylate kinase [Deltaproteobacteria bacterium]